ncbi:MAG: acyl-CoA thioesterase [Alysiella sp.]|uniref:acyl-CoA thioesterase n=1 Tax=Alysiella sp. TaxID=1872483 RepID=UPI0026DDA264|nr:acyl-CoA thioesterase [Alysiella sp.]MDO4433201.1 acyl-CoA thioesterase [Alysiella sp.]
MAYLQTVHNYHLDGYRHVNNARYLEFLEAARWHYFAQNNLEHGLRQANLVVSRIDIRYRCAAALGETLAIHSQITAVQSRQLNMQQRIVFENGKICAQADIILMPTDEQGHVCRLPENLYQTCYQLLQTS